MQPHPLDFDLGPDFKLKSKPENSYGLKHAPKVYFMRCGEFIKIGWTVNVGERIRNMRTMTPYDIEVVATMPGNRNVEYLLHCRFKAHRHRYEWFHAAPEIEAFIADLPPYDGPTR